MTLAVSLSGRLRERLAKPPLIGPLTGDLPNLRSEATIPAAVLVAVTERHEPGVILTVRRENLRTHAGEIAFPGGRLDRYETPVMAAIREAHEEIGIAPGLVSVVGVIEEYRTVTGYAVTPVIATIAPDLPLRLHEEEVADVFEVPLSYLLEPANHCIISALFGGRTRHYYEIVWNDRRIWGATAAMIVNLSRRLQWN